MFDTYLVEVQDRAAGILIRSGQAYAFHAVESPFRALEGVTFPDPVSAERAALRLVRRRGRERTAARTGYAAAA